MKFLTLYVDQIPKECGTTPACPPIVPPKAEMWLQMMNSMMNFAMASTTLMKSIQNRMENKENTTEKPLYISTYQMPAALDTYSDTFSLRSGNLEDSHVDCSNKKCKVIYDPKYGITADDGENSLKSMENPSKDCVCNKTCDKLPPVTLEEIELEEEGGKCTCESDDCLVAATRSKNCNCSPSNETVNDMCKIMNSGECPDNPLFIHITGVTTGGENCECQTDDLQGMVLLGNLTDQLKQTEETLKNLKGEVARISNLVSKKYERHHQDQFAAALYQEIMKPRLSISEVIVGTTTRKRKLG